MRSKFLYGFKGPPPRGRAVLACAHAQAPLPGEVLRRAVKMKKKFAAAESAALLSPTRAADSATTTRSTTSSPAGLVVRDPDPAGTSAR
ncbi:hypothetical protein [Embleya sp. NPDC005575]|uniref:hypothetical protein n=1 Tax=Embleya sp. NPDC005575 TaxID=3156892 RepID=UPI0033BDFA4E